MDARRVMPTPTNISVKREKDELRKIAHDAFDRLSQGYNPVVLEGAGSVSELNLRDGDIVNMSMASYADANVILVADIDRGGCSRVSMARLCFRHLSTGN